MSTTLAARATRQTLILAAIGGLHVGAFILVSTSLGDDLSQTSAAKSSDHGFRTAAPDRPRPFRRDPCQTPDTASR